MPDYVKEVIFVFMCHICQSSDDTEKGTLAAAIKRMRRRGWKIGKEQNTCPQCQGKK